MATNRRAFSIWARIVSAPSSSSAIVGSFLPRVRIKKAEGIAVASQIEPEHLAV